VAFVAEAAWNDGPDDGPFLDANGEAHLKFQIPQRTNPRDFALLAASGGIELEPNVTLAEREADRFARAATTGAGMTTIGADADTGTLTAVGRLVLDERAHVHGEVTSTLEISRHATSIVDGTVKANTPVPLQDIDWKVKFPSTRNASVHVLPMGAPRTIAPGYYAGLKVQPWGTAVLTAGTYYFSELDLLPHSILQLDNSAGRISIFVTSKLETKGTWTALQRDRADVVVGYLNDRLVDVRGPFVGTLIAPRAEVEVARPQTGFHEGAFIGHKIHVESGTRIVHASGSAIIQSVALDKAPVCSGDSVTVMVNAANPYGAEPPIVTIADLPGARQVLQMDGTGPRLISVVASAAGFTESRLVSLDVVVCGGTPPKPHLLAMPNIFHEGWVDLSIVNADAFMAPGTTYHWEFGDGSSTDTAVPAVTHSYLEGLDRDREHNHFELGLAVRRTGLPDATAAQSIAVWNRYAFQKSRGTLVPRTRPMEPELKITPGTTLASAAIDNVEDGALQLTSQRVDLQPCDPVAAPVVGTVTPVDVPVPGRGTASANVVLPSASLNGVCSIAVYHFGTLAGTRPVVASTYFNIAREPLAPRLRMPMAAADILDYVADHGLVANPKSITDEELMRVSRERRIPSDLVLHPRRANRATFAATAPAGADPKVGETCVPGDSPPVGQNLVCSRVGWSQDDVAEITNALRGDIVLSRECGPIGTLLSQVHPPQKWSHTGIMVQNYRTIAQSTGSFDYILANSAGSLFGNPAPFAGFFEHALQYVFPGTIVMPITNAYQNGKLEPAPDNKNYVVSGFAYASTRCEGREMIYPSVLKPLPSRMEELRPILHALADASSEDKGGIKGHYRFSAYSDLTSDSNPNAPDWVLESSARTMCSGLMWRAAKKLGLTLNTDKSNDLNETLPETPDGLFFYREDERRAAGEALYRSIYNMVGTAFSDAQENAFQGLHKDIGPLAYLLQPFFNVAKALEITSMVRTHAANQVTNCFASDACSTAAIGSESWKNPGTGTSVSPDDLVSWDLYGLVEPLAYHSPRSVPIYEWQLGGDAGTACGTVTRNGQPVIGATVVLSGARFEKHSLADGTFRFEGVSAGHFSLTATSFEGGQPGGEQLSATTDVDVVAGQVGPCVTLELQRPDINFRRVTAFAHLYVFDEDDEEAEKQDDVEFLLSPSHPEEHWNELNVCAGLESRGNVNVTARYVNSGAVLVTVEMTLHEGSCFGCSACNNTDLDGRLERKVLLCDDTNTGAQCFELGRSLGIDAATNTAVRDYRTDFPYRVNTVESSDEYIEVSFELHNFRQR
jgi:hypothetical protein